jgi:hypothetical protein
VELKGYQNREDETVYEPILLEVLSLFGLATHTSLERTLGWGLSQRPSFGLGVKQSGTTSMHK